MEDLTNEKQQSHLRKGVHFLGFLLMLFSKNKVSKKSIKEELSSYKIRKSILENHWSGNKETGDVEINLVLATIYRMMNSSDEIPLLETTNKVLHMNTCGVHRNFFFGYSHFAMVNKTCYLSLKKRTRRMQKQFFV